ncbi:MAG TPA: FHA domain-containing protein, partial [Aeromicrobium sp.]|nr:FHA domain-containing protein [Aeromicrobium sp.]
VTETATTPAALKRSDVVIEVNGARHPVGGQGVIIGRGSEADLRINDPGISRKHAQITVSHREGTEVEVVDLESTNGVILNGRRVTNAPVPDGSQLQLGNTHLVVRITEADRNLTDADV